MAKARSEGSLETELREVDPRDIELLELNARYMKGETFGRLVENIMADGCLTSVPLCYQRPGGLLRCVSGNHRTKAAIEAGLDKITVQIITTEISDDDFIAKQLSHNALVGMDNKDILRLLWDKIDSVDAKLYSGIDKSMLEKLDMPTIPPVDMTLEYEQVTVLFLPQEKEQVVKVFDELRRRSILSKENWVEAIEHYDEIAGAIQDLCKRETVHNYATVLLLMARYAKAYLDMIDAGEVTLGTRSTSS
ncbi:MAG TPA: ParB N-terminal domain-containing protein [Sedimentisphaerales bacterium]|nr:ParB N-terminal domain-containing protein [Sedimentisphaerales bacterium]